MLDCVFSTPRFYLRENKISDARDIYLLNADPEMLKFTGDVPFRDEQEAKYFIINYKHFYKHGFGRWVIVDKNNNEFLGWCGLKRHADGMVDLGYRIKKEHWGKGIATECAKACIHYGFDQLNLTEIVGRSAKANFASINILEKVGMRFWKADTCDGIADAVWYRIDRFTLL